MENNKRAQLGWVMFDWANSSYSLVIATAIFPTYFIAATAAEIPVFTLNISNTSLYAFSVSFAYLAICFLSPVLSGVADYSGKRKFFMRIFTLVGSLSCMGLFFFSGMQNIWFGITAFILATAGHAGSLVFYDAFLPDLVPLDQRDKLSARGYAFGYIGSVILLIFNIIMIQKPAWFGIVETSYAIRLAFLSVGIWWLGFSQLSFAWLPVDKQKHSEPVNLKKGYRELQKAWNYIKDDINIRNYLFAFFCYSAGVQTVIYLASAFAKKELHFESSQLILVILILQLVAILGAYVFALVSKRTHNLTSMKIMLFIWICICVTAFFITSHLAFYFTAGLVGLVLGGIQAISRSTYSKIIPINHPDTTCFFSFYDVLYYASIVCGTFIFGLIDQITGSMRLSVLSLIVFFMMGLYLLTRVQKVAVKI
ncbi:MAG: MFS transporter [Bacteroidota bacterium]|nr:MFS transporter [Bacteroidota bacterium]